MIKLYCLMGFIAGMVLASSVQGQVFLTNRLAAYYPLNGNVNDASGNGNNGTNYGATFTTNRFGTANSALLFNGTTSYVNFGNVSFLNGATQATWNFWINTKQTPSLGPSVVRKDDAWIPLQGGDDPIEQTWRTPLWFANGTQSYVVYGSLTNMTDGNWHMITATFNQSSFGFFIDGTPITPVTQTYPLSTTLATSTNPFTLGAAIDTGGEFFSGLLSDLSIYNRALSTNEVQELYQFESGAAQLVSASPVLLLNTSNLVVGGSYQIQTSGDLTNWTNYGVPFLATSTNAPQFVSVSGLQGFFRILPAQ